MPKNPKQEKEGSVEEDQKERGYYYDDSHGYEKFEPEEEDDRDVDSGRSGDAEMDDEDESTEGAV